MSAQQFVKTLEELELVRDKDTLFKARTLLYNNRQQIIDLVKAAERHCVKRMLDDDHELRQALASFKDKP